MNSLSVNSIGDKIKECLISPNESDSNLEPANVVDGLFAIARAIAKLANVMSTMDHQICMGIKESKKGG